MATVAATETTEEPDMSEAVRIHIDREPYDFKPRLPTARHSICLAISLRIVISFLKLAVTKKTNSFRAMPST